MATFEIGTQNAGSIQNVGGDLTIGNLRVDAAWSTVEIRHELTRLRQELAGIALPPESRTAAEAAVGAAAAEAETAAPDRGAIARRLREATTILGEAGALSTAGTGLVESLRRAAAVLGPAGKALLTLLPLL
ncbi:MAG: hypothetical protein ACRDNG_14605 [Gaiellaceae bacterium]